MFYNNSYEGNILRHYLSILYVFVQKQLLRCQIKSNVHNNDMVGIFLAVHNGVVLILFILSTVLLIRDFNLESTFF